MRRERSTLLAALAGLTLLCFSREALAPPSSSDGRSARSFRCMAPLGGSGRRVQVLEIRGPSPHWAHAFFDPYDGQPTIVYGPAFEVLPRFMRSFTRAHECCHLSMPTSNEYAANCCAIDRLSLSRDEVLEIARFTAEEAPMLPPQYGGSGREFWRRTIRMCGP